jgi:hypothetical protein
MAALIDKLEVPKFDGLTPIEGMAACEAWEDWVYSRVDSYTDLEWVCMVDYIRDNYTRYFAHFEGRDV